MMWDQVDATNSTVPGMAAPPCKDGIYHKTLDNFSEAPVSDNVHYKVEDKGNYEHGHKILSAAHNHKVAQGEYAHSHNYVVENAEYNGLARVLSLSFSVYEKSGKAQCHGDK